jgi:predicted transcriptional regulator
MVNRDRHDITFEILKKAAAGKKRTELMREVGLSYTQSKKYLSLLVEKGLLEMNEKRLFRTTDKGLEFLEKCKQCPLFKWNRQKK